MSFANFITPSIMLNDGTFGFNVLIGWAFVLSCVLIDLKSLRSLFCHMCSATWSRMGVCSVMCARRLEVAWVFFPSRMLSNLKSLGSLFCHACTVTWSHLGVRSVTHAWQLEVTWVFVLSCVLGDLKSLGSLFYHACSVTRKVLVAVKKTFGFDILIGQKVPVFCKEFR